MFKQISVHSIPDKSLAGAVISFGRLLKAQGFSVATPAILDALSGVSCVGVENVADISTVLKAVFTNRVEEFSTFDRLFREFWIDHIGETGVQDESPRCEGTELGDSRSAKSSHGMLPAEASASDSQDLEARQARPYVVYSAREALRHQDFKDVQEFQDHRMTRLIREIVRPFLRRIALRKRSVTSAPWVDFRKLLRRNIRYGGEICELPRLKPRKRVKSLVFLCDVSGSMNPYLRFMLRFIKEMQVVPTKVETFVFATRLNRITPLLAHTPFPRALEEIGHRVKDWSGGTRIGSCLREFTSYRGGALLGPSSVVLIFSDGWDRGDLALLEREMNKIHRRAYRVLWINPLLGGSSYEPTSRGMKTALPHVDSFLPGHNLVSLERLAGTLRGLM
jgi:uncharacterized protein